MDDFEGFGKGGSYEKMLAEMENDLMKQFGQDHGLLAGLPQNKGKIGFKVKKVAIHDVDDDSIDRMWQADSPFMGNIGTPFGSSPWNNNFQAPAPEKKPQIADAWAPTTGDNKPQTTNPWADGLGDSWNSGWDISGSNSWASGLGTSQNSSDKGQNESLTKDHPEKFMAESMIEEFIPEIPKPIHDLSRDVAEEVAGKMQKQVKNWEIESFVPKPPANISPSDDSEPENFLPMKSMAFRNSMTLPSINKSVPFVANCDRFDQLRKNLERAGQKFVDEQFPANYSSLVGHGENIDQEHASNYRSYVWKRPEEIF